MRRSHRHRLQPRIAPHAGGDPAAGQRRHRPHGPGVGQTRHACRVGHHAAPVTLVGVAPAQGHASAGPPPRHHHPQGTRLGQAAQATAVARRTLSGLGGRLGVQPHNGGGGDFRGRHGQRRLLGQAGAPMLRHVQPRHATGHRACTPLTPVNAGKNPAPRTAPPLQQ